jgi:hypothetical protein
MSPPHPGSLRSMLGHELSASGHVLRRDGGDVSAAVGGGPVSRCLQRQTPRRLCARRCYRQQQRQREQAPRHLACAARPPRRAALFASVTVSMAGASASCGLTESFGTHPPRHGSAKPAPSRGSRRAAHRVLVHVGGSVLLRNAAMAGAREQRKGECPPAADAAYPVVASGLMLRTLQTLVLAMIAALATVSSTTAFAPKTALRALHDFSPARVGALATQQREAHQQNTLGYGDVASDASLAARGAAGLGEEIGILRSATKGAGNFGLGAADAETAVKLGESWVGEGATLASDGKTLLSADKLRQFRPPSWKPNLGRVQANFEQRLEAAGRWLSNGHLDILYGPVKP